MITICVFHGSKLLLKWSFFTDLKAFTGSCIIISYHNLRHQKKLKILLITQLHHIEQLAAAIKNGQTSKNQF